MKTAIDALAYFDEWADAGGLARVRSNLAETMLIWLEEEGIGHVAGQYSVFLQFVSLLLFRRLQSGRQSDPPLSNEADWRDAISDDTFRRVAYWHDRRLREFPADSLGPSQ